MAAATDPRLREHLLREQIKELQRLLQQEQDRATSTTQDMTIAPKSRLLVVANRLPMSLKKDTESGEWSFRMSSGGLVSALLGVKDIEMVWIGWPGAEIGDSQEKEHVRERLREQNCEPVFLPQGMSAICVVWDWE